MTSGERQHTKGSEADRVEQEKRRIRRGPAGKVPMYYEASLPNEVSSHRSAEEYFYSFGQPWSPISLTNLHPPRLVLRIPSLSRTTLTRLCENESPTGTTILPPISS